MTATAADLVDHVIPNVPLRQFVLTLPFELRATRFVIPDGGRLAYDGELLGAVSRAFVDSVLAWNQRHMRARGISGGKSGVVTVVQRVSSEAHLTGSLTNATTLTTVTESMMRTVIPSCRARRWRSVGAVVTWTVSPNSEPGAKRSQRGGRPPVELPRRRRAVYRVLMKRACLVALAGLTALGRPNPVSAQATAKHGFHQVRPDSVDLVVSAGWDYAQAPVGEGDRKYLEDGLREFAKTTHQATEGRLRICKVYVYKQKNAQLADIVVRSERGRANADIGALYNDWGQIRSFLGSKSRKYGATEFGQVLAHEFGHYGLFIKDEYTEPKTTGEAHTEFSAQVCDVTLPTLMGDRVQLGMSLPIDYSARLYPPWRGGAGNKQEKYRSCDGLQEVTGETAREDATFRTVQWRTYQMSAWELMVNGPRRQVLGSTFSDTQRVERFESVMNGGVPAELDPPDYDGACFQPIFLDGAFVVMLIDHSISMLTKGATGGTYFDRAIAAAQNYVSSIPAGVTLTILEFGATTSVVVPATKFEEATLAQTKKQVSDALAAFKTIVPTGNSTGLDQGMIDALPIFVKGAELGNLQFSLVISDGDTVLQDWIAASFVGIGVPIFTVGTGSYKGEDVLQDVSLRTRGAFKASPGWQHGQIEDELYREEPTGLRRFPKPPNQAPLEAPVELGELDGSTSFRGYFQANSPATFELVAPDGSLVTPATLPAGTTYESDESSATYLVTKPAAGKWTPRLVPQAVANGDLSIAVKSQTPLSLRVDVRGGENYPDPFIVRAALSARQPVVEAQVVGTFGQTAGPAPKEVLFLDDGVAPDEEQGDGVYTAVVHTLEQDGKYELEVVASNPKLTARIDSSFVSHDPGEPDEPVALSAFTRQGLVTLEVKNQMAMPQSPDGALELRNDLTPKWVAINAPGDVVWLEFNGYKNGRYLAMTGDFLAHDDKPFMTRLGLYDTDRKTLIASNAGDDGRAQVPLDTPGQDGKYYLKVEHAGSGVGRLRVAVAPREWFQSPAKKSAVDDDSGLCSFGSGDERAPVVPALLAGVAAWVARRARRARPRGVG